MIVNDRDADVRDRDRDRDWDRDRDRDRVRDPIRFDNLIDSLNEEAHASEGL